MPLDYPAHGGDLSWARTRFGDPPAPWLDLSTGISPFPYPIPEDISDDLERLPDAADMTALIDAMRRYYKVPPGADVVPCPGAEAAIAAVTRLVPPGPVAIVSPTYGGHEAAWRAAGREIRHVDSPSPQQTGGDVTAVVFCHPNNPDGRMFDPLEAVGQAVALAPCDGLVVVDESYADLVPACSLVSVAERAGLIVLRSFGKFFGLPGLRLGAAIAEPALAARLRACFGAWPVSTPAARIGARAMTDRDWIDRQQARLRSSAERRDVILGRAGAEPVGGTALFRLVASPDAGTWFEALGRRGIFVRRFPDRPDWLRIGLSPDEDGYRRLADALGVKP